MKGLNSINFILTKVAMVFIIAIIDVKFANADNFEQYKKEEKDSIKFFNIDGKVYEIYRLYFSQKPSRRPAFLRRYFKKYNINFYQTSYILDDISSFQENYFENPFSDVIVLGDIGYYISNKEKFLSISKNLRKELIRKKYLCYDKDFNAILIKCEDCWFFTNYVKNPPIGRLRLVERYYSQLEKYPNLLELIKIDIGSVFDRKYINCNNLFDNVKKIIDEYDLVSHKFCK